MPLFKRILRAQAPQKKLALPQEDKNRAIDIMARTIWGEARGERLPLRGRISNTDDRGVSGEGLRAEGDFLEPGGRTSRRRRRRRRQPFDRKRTSARRVRWAGSETEPVGKGLPALTPIQRSVHAPVVGTRIDQPLLEG